MPNNTPDRMVLQGSYLRINMPDMFADQEGFVDYLNDPDNALATWHHKGDPNPAETSDCFDEIGGDFLAKSSNKDFDRIGIAVKVLIIKMLGQFGPRNDPIAVMH